MVVLAVSGKEGRKEGRKDGLADECSFYGANGIVVSE